MGEERGPWSVRFYLDLRGRSVVEDYIDELPAKSRAKIRNHIRLLRELGTAIGMPQAKAVTGHKPLWELRPMPYRILYFLHTGRTFWLLHAFRKTGNRLRDKDISLAETRMEEVKEGEP